MIGVDTNVLLRRFVDDDPAQARVARDLVATVYAPAFEGLTLHGPTHSFPPMPNRGNAMLQPCTTLDLKPGDQIAFDPPGTNSSTIEPRRKRSIFDRLEEFKFCLARPLTQQDIEDSISEEMNGQEERSRRG
jgi:hypothetical protein